MNLELEKNNVFSAQEIYNIISEAIDMADDDGFINSFVFERALYVCAARVLYQDQEDIFDLINTSLIEDGSPLMTWQKLLENEVIDSMAAEYKDSLDNLATIGNTWFEEYTEAAHSMRSIVDVIEALTGGMASTMTGQLDAFKDAEVQNIINIADKWGLNQNADLINKS